MIDTLFLLLAGLLAGSMNALAGGGSFVSLPALISAGVPSVGANATSTVALFPGGLASTWVYRAGLTAILSLQFLLGVYGGYFGGAVGLMMMAVWSILDGAEVKALNAPRTFMVSAANGIAVLSFIVAGAVAWTACLLVGLGAIAGGWCGAHIGRILPPAVIRAGTLLLATATTVAFFVRAYV
jgi:uncharacterized membrane protein YfcA